MQALLICWRADPATPDLFEGPGYPHLGVRWQEASQLSVSHPLKRVAFGHPSIGASAPSLFSFSQAAHSAVCEQHMQRVAAIRMSVSKPRPWGRWSIAPIVSSIRPIRWALSFILSIQRIGRSSQLADFVPFRSHLSDALIARRCAIPGRAALISVKGPLVFPTVQESLIVCTQWMGDMGQASG